MKYLKSIQYAAELITASQYLVVFTGAGISTGSGIPDYRGPNGVWTRRDQGLPPSPMTKPWAAIQPNAGHQSLVQLQSWGMLKFLISQNVDNLHLASGIFSENLAELHGNRALMRCLDCDVQFPKENLWNEKRWGPGYRTSPTHPNQPKCPTCSGRLISSIVNFGDPMPRTELKNAIFHSQNADVFVVIGSSLLVSPANDMPAIARKAGAKLIIINQMDTPFDLKTDVRFHEDATQVLNDLIAAIRILRHSH